MNHKDTNYIKLYYKFFKNICDFNNALNDKT